MREASPYALLRTARNIISNFSLLNTVGDFKASFRTDSYSMRTRWRKRILSILPLHPTSSSRIEMRHRTARSSTLLASACLALPLMINGASNAATSQQSPLEACNTIRQRTEASSMSHQPQYQGNCAITANERRAIVRERMTV